MNTNLKMNIKTGIKKDVPGIFVSSETSDIVMFFPVSKNKIAQEDFEKMEDIRNELVKLMTDVKKDLLDIMKEEKVSFEDLIMGEKKRYEGDPLKQACFVSPYHSDGVFFTFCSAFSDMEALGFSNGVYFETEKFTLTDHENMLKHLTDLDEKFILLFKNEFPNVI